jgi:hypothetical protein
MNNSFKKNLIAASVGAVLAAGSFAANAGTPGTSNLLFPYVTTATGSYTFISIAAQNGVAVPTPVHFTYATKATSASNTAVCTHLDGDAMMTANDLMQFEIQNKVNMPTSFGDTTSVPKYFPNNAAAANQHGMLIVNNDPAGAYGSGATYVNANLYGEARIINTATGLAAGYSTDDLHTPVTGANPQFLGGPDTGLGTKVISWFPDPTVSTSWFVLPLGTEIDMAFTGNVWAQYRVTDNTALIGGHYNNNEGFQSSTATATVACLGTFDRATLLGALNSPWSANGGWGNFTQTVAAPPAGYIATTNALVYKMESTSALGGVTSFITREPTM